MKFPANTKGKARSKGKLVLLVLIIVLIFFAINLAKSWRQNSQIDQEVAVLEKDIKTLEEGNFKLKELIKYFNSSAYIEEKARLDLGLKKEGEKVVVVTETTNQNNTNQAEPNLASTDKDKNSSNVQKWWKYFFE